MRSLYSVKLSTNRSFMNEKNNNSHALIAAYEEKIASLEATISIQDQMINSLADFLKDTAGELYPIIADSVKNSAECGVKIQKLKDQLIQSIEVSDQDASDLNITPDNEEEEDDFVVDDFVVADDNEEEEDDFVVAD